MTDPRRISALAHRTPLAAGNGMASLAERPFGATLVLRGRREAIDGRVAPVIGGALPAAVTEMRLANGLTTCWLGPDEWWVLGVPGSEAALKTSLDAALAGVHVQVADVSDYYTTIALAGSASRDMLMTLATVDLHPRVFRAGQCVVTNVGRATPLVVMTAGSDDRRGDAFDLVIRLSMADYLWCLLAEAGMEHGLPRLSPKGRVKLHLPHLEAGSSARH